MRISYGLVGLLGLFVPSIAYGEPAPPNLKTLKVIEAHGTRTRTLAFDAAGTILVSGGSDRRLRIWDAKTLKLRSTWTAPARDNYEP